MPSSKKKSGSEGKPKLKSESEPLDNIMRVTTPENISFQYEVVGPFRRLFAYLIDVAISAGAYALLCFVVFLVFFFILAPLAAMLQFGGLLDEIGGLGLGFLAVAYFLIYWFYFAYFETYYNGATLGKSLMRMRVISIDGHAIDGSQAVLRNFFRLLDLMPIISFSSLFEYSSEVDFNIAPTFFFGLVVMMLNRRYQRLGDLVANTVVVNEERARLPDLEMFQDPRVPKLAELIPDSFFVAPSMARAVADYVDHRRTLNYQRASEIASYLAVPLLERFSMAPDTDHDLLLCSLYYKVFIHQVDEEEAVSIAEVGPPEATLAQATITPVGVPGDPATNPNLGNRP